VDILRCRRCRRCHPRHSARRCRRCPRCRRCCCIRPHPRCRPCRQHRRWDCRRARRALRVRGWLGTGSRAKWGSRSCSRRRTEALRSGTAQANHSTSSTDGWADCARVRDRGDRRYRLARFRSDPARADLVDHHHSGPCRWVRSGQAQVDQVGRCGLRLQRSRGAAPTGLRSVER
jgi:hypothetical protein